MTARFTTDRDALSLSVSPILVFSRDAEEQVRGTPAKRKKKNAFCGFSPPLIVLRFISALISHRRLHHSTCSDRQSCRWEPFRESQVVPLSAHCCPLVARHGHTSRRRSDRSVRDGVSPPSGGGSLLFHPHKEAFGAEIRACTRKRIK